MNNHTILTGFCELGYYPPMSAMQMGGQPAMYPQPYPQAYPQRRSSYDCCDCCCDCSCCLGM